jgi:hypothetical protein
MKIITYKCDKCGKEIQLGNICFVNVENSFGEVQKEFHFCHECSKQPLKLYDVRITE